MTASHTPQASEPQTPSTRAHIGILVVAYNAESTLRSVLERIPPAVLAKIEEIVVFDDASQDRTFEVGESLQDRFRGVKLSIYRNPVNLMYGGNQRRGFVVRRARRRWRQEPVARFQCGGTEVPPSTRSTPFSWRAGLSPAVSFQVEGATFSPAFAGSRISVSLRTRSRVGS